MNKYLMLTAAALLGSATPVPAANEFKSHTIHFQTQGGGSYCDGMSAQYNRSACTGFLLRRCVPQQNITAWA